jgi:hypothetical protein
MFVNLKIHEKNKLIIKRWIDMNEKNNTSIAIILWILVLTLGIIDLLIGLLYRQENFSINLILPVVLVIILIYEELRIKGLTEKINNLTKK